LQTTITITNPHTLAMGELKKAVPRSSLQTSSMLDCDASDPLGWAGMSVNRNTCAHDASGQTKETGKARRSKRVSRNRDKQEVTQTTRLSWSKGTREVEKEQQTAQEKTCKNLPVTVVGDEDALAHGALDVEVDHKQHDAVEKPRLALQTQVSRVEHEGEGRWKRNDTGVWRNSDSYCRHVSRVEHENKRERDGKWRETVTHSAGMWAEHEGERERERERERNTKRAWEKNRN
jgi:hypothetical protein